MSLEAAGIPERENEEDSGIVNHQTDSTQPFTQMDKQGEMAELARLSQRNAELLQEPLGKVDEILLKCLVKVQQNCILALNTLIFSTLTAIKPISASDWRSVSDKYSTSRNLHNLSLNVNYAFVTHLNAPIRGDLSERIERISYLFSPIDAKLVVALDQFADVLAVMTGTEDEVDSESELERVPSRTSSQKYSSNSSSSNEVYDTLQSQMSQLKLEMRTNHHKENDMWVKVETFINLINILCMERENTSEMPPSYSDLSMRSIHRQLSNKSVSSASVGSSVQDEKMRRDLERVTDSIDRLMGITPQLAGQRVELSQKQVVEMDLAKLAGEVEASVKTSKSEASTSGCASVIGSANTSKQSNNGVGKFFPKSISSRRSDNQIISGIEKANNRRLDSQRVEMGSRLKDAHTKMRDADLIDIIERNSMGRMVQQESQFSEASKLRQGNNPRSSRDSNDSQTHSMVSHQAYLAEHNINVGNVLVQFKTQLHGQSRELEVEIDEQDRDTAVLKNLSSYNVRLNLPTGVVWPQHRTAKLVEKDLFEFNLQVTHQSRKSLTTPAVEPPSYPFSAVDFAVTRPSSFCCAKCGRDLSSGELIHNYRDLPSDNWSEHVDNWMCHPAQELNADYYRTSLSDAASPDEALIGSNYWVFHKKNMVERSLKVESNEQQIEPTLKCVCGSTVGSVQGEAFFRLSKVAVRPIAQGTAYHRYNIGHYISAELVDQSRNYGSYRYFLQDEDSGELRLLVWLFNPLVRLRTSQLSLNATVDACKLFWKTSKEEPFHDNRMGKIPRLSYPGWILDEFEKLLMHGIASFLADSPRRFFSDWHIGYIERVGVPK